jgi:flagellar motor switch protein FliG
LKGLFPYLYLKGLSPEDFSPVLLVLLGKDAALGFWKALEERSVPKRVINAAWCIK